MADGAYRFHQPGGGPFYSGHHNRNHNRVTSPHGARRPLLTDTPSPSRSPANPAMLHNYGVYSQNGYQGQHMNGGQNHQRYNNVHGNSAKHNHHGHHNQHYSSQQHNSQASHQHNISSGVFQVATPQSFLHDQLQNGNRELESDDMSSEFAKEQYQIYEDLKEADEGHQRARTYAQQTKSLAFGGPLGGNGDDTAIEDRVRTATAQMSSSQAWTELDMGGQGLCALSKNLFKYTFLTRLDLPHNKLRFVSPAIGQLRSLDYLNLAFNDLHSLPDELCMLTNLRTLHLCGNKNLEELPNKLGFLYNLETISILETGIPEMHEQVLLEGGTKALISCMLENMSDYDPPMDRPWHKFDEDAPHETDDTFSAVTYNILCERYASRQKYGYVPEKCLNWLSRRDIIFEELCEYNADVICLQELDRSSYDDFFRQRLAEQGYKGYFAQKSRAETIGENAKFVDGCGTFWKDRKYIVLDTQHIVLGRKAVDRPGAKASADMLNRVWQRDDIATITLLENRVTGYRLIVVNSHVFWDPAFKDVKLVQVAVLLEELNRLADKWARDQKPVPLQKKQMFKFSDTTDNEDQLPQPGPSLEYSAGAQIPTIVCGDFNSGPGSPVYELFTKRALDANHDDFAGRDYGSFSTGGMSHDFTLKSTNALISPRFITNYTPDFMDELDHIFYSSNTLTPIGALGELDVNYLKTVPGFPNQHFPSDHVALKAEFRVEKQRTAQKVEADFGSSSRRH